MICPKCKSEIADESVFCSKCGCAIGNTSNEVGQEPVKDKKKVNFKVVIGVVAGIIVVAGAVVFGVYNSKPSTKYAKAEKAIANQNYEQAVKYYTAAGDYSDAPNKLIEANYANNYVKGKKEFDKANYDEAIELLEAANGHEDSKELINQCKYNKGISEKEAGNYVEAAELLKSSAYYDDSNDVILSMVKDLVIEEKYDEAVALFDYSKNGTKDKYEQYAKAKIAYKEKRYTDAHTYFSGAGDILDAEDLYKDSMYNDAKDKFASRKYDTASMLFNRVKGYEDSDEMITACDLMEAKNNMSEGNLNKAKSTLERLPADYQYSGVKVSDLLSKINANEQWVNICGKWTSTSGQMRSTQDGSYYDYWWYRDFKEGDVNVDVRCVLNDDGSVSVKVRGKYPVYTTYSVISSGVKEAEFGVNIDEKMNSMGKINVDDYATFTVGSSGMTLNYKLVDRSQDVYFKYIYTTNVTYGKKTQSY